MNKTIAPACIALFAALLASCAEVPVATPSEPAASSGLIPRAVIFGNPERAAGRISPDGKHVSFLAPREGVLNIWVVAPNRTSFYAVTEGFLARCLGGRFEPVGNDFRGSSITVPTGVEFVPGIREALASN